MSALIDYLSKIAYIFNKRKLTQVNLHYSNFEMSKSNDGTMIIMHYQPHHKMT